MSTSCQPPAMNQQDQGDLWRLRTRWLGTYHVALVDETWRAKPYGNVTHLITADTADELAEAITRDYDAARMP